MSPPPGRDRIIVHLQDHECKNLGQARIAPRVPVQDLMPQILASLNLPTNGPGGLPIAYRLAFSERLLPCDMSLSEAGVASGADLAIVPDGRTARPAMATTQIIANNGLRDARPVLREEILDTTVVTPRRANSQFDIHADTPNFEIVRRVVLAFAGSDDDRFIVTLEGNTTAYDPPPEFHLIQDNYNWNSEIAHLETLLWKGIRVRDIKVIEQIERIGDQFSKCLFHPDSGVRVLYGNASGGVGDRHGDLTLRFDGRAGHISFPFELLRRSEEWLALRHPIYRRVAGARTDGTLREKLLYLQRQTAPEGPLKLLFISADGATSDSLIEGLSQTARTSLDVVGLKHEIKTLYSNEATRECVIAELKTQKAHIVHFAGKCHGGPDVGASGGILLRSAPTRSDTCLHADHLGHLLHRAGCLLFFLSTSQSASVGGRRTQSLHDSLRLVGGIVKKDVPNVLAYRWTVAPKSAAIFETSFYGELFASQSVPYAVMEARKAAYDHDPVEQTWLAPVLIAQNP